MRMQDKVALVVGGSQALGRAIAEELAAEGAVTIVNSRLRPEAPEVVTELQARGLRAFWEPGDMADPEQMVELVERVVAQHGKLDAMVVSGAPPSAGGNMFLNMPPEDYRKMLDGQFISRLNCLRAAVAPMAAQHYGKVVFITSDAGKTPTPGESLVGAAAAALMFFTRAAGRELAPKGIRINCISPSLTADTPAQNYAESYGSDNPISKVFAKIEAKTPFRLNIPSDIAKLALFLACPESDQISGACVSINGGLSFP